jgi:hypothetical protein
MGQPETSPIYMQEGQIGPCLAAAAPGAAPGMPSVGSRYAEVRTPSSAVIAAVFAGGSITTSLWPMTGRFGLGNLSRRTSGFRRSCRLSSLVIRQKAKARGLDHRLSCGPCWRGRIRRCGGACAGAPSIRGPQQIIGQAAPCCFTPAWNFWPPGFCFTSSA